MKPEDKDVKDLLEQYLLVARQQMAPSHILLEIQRDIKMLKDNDEKFQKSLEPLIKEYNDSKGFWSRFFFIGKVAGATTAIALLIVGAVQFFKKG